MINRTAIAVLVVLGGFASTASAQSSWQALEAEIRQQRTGTPIPAESATGVPAAENATPQQAYLGLAADDQNDRGRGVRIVKVTPGGPAEQAGLKVDDLITDLGDVRIRAMSDMEAVVKQMAPGEMLVVEVLRGQRRHKIPVTFGLRENEPSGAKPTQVSIAPQIETQTAKPQAALFAPPSKQLPAAPNGLKTTALRTPPALPDASADVQQLRQRVQELEKRVEQLERALREKK